MTVAAVSITVIARQIFSETDQSKLKHLLIKISVLFPVGFICISHTLIYLWQPGMLRIDFFFLDYFKRVKSHFFVVVCSALILSSLPCSSLSLSDMALKSVINIILCSVSLKRQLKLVL